MSKPKKNSEGQVATVEKTKVAKPPLYAVVILNDDYTPMDFVVHVLIRFFQMTEEKAIQVMLSVHTQGRGVCGQYTKEIAETKAKQVMDLAEVNEYPLQCRIETV